MDAHSHQRIARFRHEIEGRSHDLDLLSQAETDFMTGIVSAMTRRAVPIVEELAKRQHGVADNGATFAVGIVRNGEDTYRLTTTRNHANGANTLLVVRLTDDPSEPTSIVLSSKISLEGDTVRLFETNRPSMADVVGVARLLRNAGPSPEIRSGRTLHDDFLDLDGGLPLDETRTALHAIQIRGYQAVADDLRDRLVRLSGRIVDRKVTLDDDMNVWAHEGPDQSTISFYDQSSREQVLTISHRHDGKSEQLILSTPRAHVVHDIGSDRISALDWFTQGRRNHGVTLRELSGMIAHLDQVEAFLDAEPGPTPDVQVAPTP